MHQLNELWVDQNLPNASCENLCADFLPQSPFIQPKHGVSAWYDGIFIIVLTSHHNTTTKRCSPELGKPDQIDFHFRLSNPDGFLPIISVSSIFKFHTPKSLCGIVSLPKSPTDSQHPNLGGPSKKPYIHTDPTQTQLGLEVANFRGESPLLCVQISMVQSRSTQLGTKTLLNSSTLGFCLNDGQEDGWIFTLLES